ncbi:MAG TPA: DUF4910 domain-containing protein [Terriglobales bacterium]|nr:DUF4910 domain-containing protein [Terriglobales bacterium]
MIESLSQRIPQDIGNLLYGLSRELFPLNRSITGQGVRDTLAVVGRVIPLEIHAIPTGTPVFDWVVPKEWNLREAYIEDAAGNRIVDSRENNLHVVGYSIPIDATMSLRDLAPHLHTLPKYPDWIPYRTSYYKETWGFCLTQRQFESLSDQRYRVRIDATLEPGVLNYGEALIPGETDEEILLSAHICHPSLANDNLSGIAIAAWIGRLLAEQKSRYTYRLLFAPGTIGSIAWLATRADVRPRIKHGLVTALLGRPGPITYKKSRNGRAVVDRAAAHVLAQRARGDQVIDFSPWGYDERQFNSPGIGMNIGRVTRAAEGGYPEYHTSADNLSLITPSALEDSYRAICEIIDILERDARYVNLRPNGEPQLGKYGLYDALGGASSVENARLAMLWVLNLSDGSNSLLDIAERSGLAFLDIHFATERLKNAGIISRAHST